MRTLTIDIAGPADGTRNGDAVIIWAPEVRPSTTRDGGLISTAPHRIPLDQGEATIQVEPGPLHIQLQVGGFTDTKPRTVTVPDGTEPINLTTLLGF